MISIETAKEYFNNHLLGTVFLESKNEQMTAAVSMAEHDIRALLRCPVSESSGSYIAAVCEQALFLLTGREQLAENKILVSETVEGLGSRSYAERKAVFLAPRAEIYLADLNSAGTVKISRG